MENNKVTYPDSVTPITNKHRYLIEIREKSREVYESMPFGNMLTAVYDASFNDVRYLDTMMMPGSVYKGYEDYDPSRASLYRERVVKMILGKLPMSAWGEYVDKWYTNGGKEVQKRVTRWYKSMELKSQKT